VWNAKFGEKLFDLNEDWVDCMPGTDLVVTSSTDKGKIWNAKSGEMLFDLTGLEESIMCITSVPGTTYLVVTGSLYNTGKVWNAKSGEMLFDLTGHDGREWKLTAVLGMQMEGRSLIVDGLVDGFILVWQASTGEMLVRFHLHRSETRFCASARPPWCPFSGISGGHPDDYGTPARGGGQTTAHAHHIMFWWAHKSQSCTPCPSIL